MSSARLGEGGEGAGLGNGPRNSRFAMAQKNLGLMLEIIRKDPESYKEEFCEQLSYYEQTMKLLAMQPEQHRMELEPLLETVTFLSGLARFYPEEAKVFCDSLFNILRDQAEALDRHVRLSFCKAILYLRIQGIVDVIRMLELFFELVKLEDKYLRKFILSSISNHLKRMYQKKKDPKLFGKIQNFCFAKLKDSRSIVARSAQLVCIDAFRKNLWRDARTTNVIADTCFHKLPKIQMTSMKFFLGTKESEEEKSDISEDDEEEKQDDAKTVKEVMTSFRHAKKTRKRAKNLEKVKKAVDKKKKAKKEGRSKECNLFAIQSLYDPQQFVDRLFGMLEGKKVDRFEVRLTRIGLCARLIGIHRLHTLGFYSYLHRYLQPKQRDVTRILLYAAQACHELTPPDTVEQLVRVIANNFVTDRNSPEAMTVGINAIREIFANCPFAATEELLRDLAEYKSYKNKNVSVAARALITLFRQMNPRLLHRKDRGRLEDRGGGEEEREFVGYAKPTVHNFVAGAEILDERDSDEGQEVLKERGNRQKQRRSDDEDSDSELDVSDVDTDEVATDSDADNEQPPTKKKRLSKTTEKREESDDDDDSDGEWHDVEQSGDEEIDDEELELDDEEMEEEEIEEEDMSEEEEECSDEDEEQEDVDEQQADQSGQKEQTEEDPKKKAQDICETRILTQEDFKQIRQYQLKKQIIGEKRWKKKLGKKKKNDDVMLIEAMSDKIYNKGQGDGLTRLRDIEQFYKKKKQTKAERLEDIKAGRDEDRQFGKPKKNGPHVGKTNRQNTKKKVAAMVKAKKRGENRQRSFRDRQKSLRNYLLRQNGVKPK